MRGVFTARNPSSPDLAKPVDPGEDATPVMSRRGRDRQLMRRSDCRPAGIQHGGVDVAGQLVVIDEDTHASVGRGPFGEYVQSEMQRPVLRDVVVGDRVAEREAIDTFAVTGFDDDAEATTVCSERPVGSDVEVTVVGAGWMSDMGCRRLVEQISK